MNIPGYDAWVLRGPEEHPEPEVEECAYCGGTGQALDDGGDPGICRHCNGNGVTEADAEEPDGDYKFERRRDAKWEDGQ